MRLRVLLLVAAAACAIGACGSADRAALDGGAADDEQVDARATGSIRPPADASAATAKDSGAKDAGTKKDGAVGDAGSVDAGASAFDAGGMADAGSIVDASTTPTGPITGGPCLSGAPGATALRVAWTNAGGTAHPSYEVNGLPDKSRWKVGAYGYQIGFSPSFVDPYLGSGGLQLDGSDFVDIELSTVGLSVIHSVTLSLYGRSYDTTTDGSFTWQTFVGTGASPSGSVSNAAPYTWTSADATTELTAGDANALLRIKAGPPSSSLVVHRIELCIDAD